MLWLAERGVAARTNLGKVFGEVAERVEVNLVSGFGVTGLGWGIGAQGFGFGFWGARFWVRGWGRRVSGLAFGVWVSGVRVWG